MVSKKKSAKVSVKARVIVYPRPEILDPQGRAIAEALARLDFDGVSDVRAGKSFDIVLTGASVEEARSNVERMADALLANSVVEDYSVEILDDPSHGGAS